MPDFVWPAARLVLEVDGLGVHATRAAAERDRRRDQLLAPAGYRVIRATWGQVVREPASLAVTLDALL